MRKRILTNLLVTTLPLLIAGCITPQPGTTVLAPTPIGNHPVLATIGNLSSLDLTKEIPVFLFSNRELREKPRGVDPFGNKRSGNLLPSLGIANVVVGQGLTQQEIIEETLSPKKRKKARVAIQEVELFPLPESVDPWKIGVSTKKHQDSLWVQALREKLDQSENRTITVYVHGFNTHLVTNTELAAEMNHYAGRQGVALNFEWPSQGKILGYGQDKNNAVQSTRYFRGIISNLALETDATSVNIVAHSAGTPIVVNALRELRLLEFGLSPAELQQKYKIDRVILAAPDMDLMAFLNAVFDRFHDTANGVAVYASPKDKALKLSGKIFGERRLGRSVGELSHWENLVLKEVEKIEMIDVTSPEGKMRELMGHEYFYRNPWVSADISAFIHGIAPEERGLTLSDEGVFWAFPKELPRRTRAELQP